MRPLVAIASTFLVVLSVAGTASAASTTLYLASDANPNGSMTSQSPSADSPVLAILSPSSNGATETSAAKFRSWSHDLSGHIASINEFTIWVAPAQSAKRKTVSLSVHLMDCAGTCHVLSSRTKSLGGVESLTKLTLPMNVRQHEFRAGHRLVLKVTVPEESEEDVVIAYASSEHPSSLHLSLLEALPTTTTTQASTTTTTQATSTTTAPTTTTTTIQSALDPSSTTSTTLPSTSTTTPEPEVLPPPTTTTTTIPGPTTEFEPSRLEIEIMDPYASERPEATEPSSTIAASGPRIMLEPIDGLMVGFSSVVETFRLYWQVALALGVVMSALLVFGFARLEVPSAEQNPFDRLRRAGTR